MKHKILLTGYGLWGILGCYRGAEYYRNEINRKYKRYLRDPRYTSKPRYYYLTCIGSCIQHTFEYLFPITLPVHLCLELYKLEEWVRDIKEKDEGDD
jgi:hypothetical protein